MPCIFDWEVYLLVFSKAKYKVKLFSIRKTSPTLPNGNATSPRARGGKIR